MSYEYLKGTGMGLEPIGGSGKERRTTPSSGSSTTIPAGTISIVGSVVKPTTTTTPKVPGGHVTTKPEERAELKEWCRQTLGQASSFYKEKLSKDPTFSYMNANVLARYRNSVETVVDMFKGQSSGTAKAEDVRTMKVWWEKCHKDTFVIFKLRQRSQGKDDSWVPPALYAAYKASYKTTGVCPNAAQKKLLFEYKGRTLPATLLKEEAARKQKALTENVAKVSIVVSAAKTAKTEAKNKKKKASDLKKEAQKQKNSAFNAKKRLGTTQSAAKTLQSQVESLKAQLAAAPTTTAISQLQAQINDLTNQLASAQAQAQAAQAQVQQFEVAAVQTESLVVQAEADAIQAEQQAEQAQLVADQMSEELLPWYMQYKWYLLGGLAVVGAGVFWYVKNRQPISAVTKNGLPVPLSARHPSGLSRNRNRRNRKHW